MERVSRSYEDDASEDATIELQPDRAIGVIAVLTAIAIAALLLSPLWGIEW
jgi:hypothetical protein